MNNQNISRYQIEEPVKTSRSVTLAGIFLFLQGLIFLLLGILFYTTMPVLDWMSPIFLFSPDEIGFFSRYARETGLILISLGVSLAVITLMFFRRWRSGWIMGLLVQGIILGASLIHYFRQDSFFIYPFMVYSIYLVINLNFYEVRIAFQKSADLDNNGQGLSASDEI